MEKFISHTGIGVPLRRSNVDTDQIIPAVFLKRVTKTGFDDALFYAWRREPDFILNREPYNQGSVLVAGPDFGTGSSREHAVWALRDYGFKVVLAPKFADIFRGNAGKQGLVTGIIRQDDCEKLWELREADPGAQITVSLEDIALTLRHEAEITAYEERRPSFKPKTLPAKTLPLQLVVSARPVDSE